ncbi:DUF6510 family protein [Allosalinactinospora lopnorensis]|uniref:DUF6510 family protein n=1 Tax=Allosalinactinospora lopnorensis TaxID=1352348 RepID=UPI000623DD1A|nr:DUF6510 family protein [Allosalinactinospora lopnorensis]
MTTSSRFLPEERRLDANMLAGPLSEIFAVDLTPAFRRCSMCGHGGAFAQLHVYVDCPGLVARCPNCQSLVLRLVRNGNTVWLDLGGTGCLRLHLE